MRYNYQNSLSKVYLEFFIFRMMLEHNNVIWYKVLCYLIILNFPNTSTRRFIGFSDRLSLFEFRFIE